jgi:Flp pilus assembly protein TadB
MPPEENDGIESEVLYMIIAAWLVIMVGILVFAMPNMIFWGIVLVALIPAALWAWRHYKIRRDAKRFIDEIERELRK